MRGLYIHIPYCNSICNYCDFHKTVSFDKNRISNYIDLLIKELASYKKYLNEEIISIYIGGGTPNVLDLDNLEKLLLYINNLNLHFKEFTIEINPELLTHEQVILFKKYNINRVSIGAQSFNDEHLKYLGRHHTYKDIVNSIELLRKEGITNINIDLMYAYPIDTIGNVLNNIKIIKELKIPHISLYSLILEEKTVFYHKYLKNKFKPLDDDLVSDMMDLINNNLKDIYHHYEISNYSYPGYESIHNMLYWKSLEYIGVGIGASGYLNSIRYDNNISYNKYIKNYIYDETKLDLNDKKKEFFLLGLRMLDGVSIKEYKKRFKSDPLEDFDFSYLMNNNLIQINKDIIKVTKKGYMLENVVAKEFI